MVSKQINRRRSGNSFNPHYKTARTALMLAAAGIAAGMSASSTRAATYIYDPGLSTTSGTDGAGVWDTTTGNWFNVSNNSVGPWSNLTTDTAIFGSGGTAGNVTVASTGVSVGTLQFNTVSGAYNLSGGPITFAATGIVTAGTSGTSAVFGSNLSGGATSMTFTGGGNYTFTGTNTYAGSTIVNNASISYLGAASTTGTGFLDIGTGGSNAVMTVNTTGSMTFNTNAFVGDSGNGAVRQMAGTVSVNTNNANYLTMGNGTNGYGSYLLSGGILNAGGTGGASGLRLGSGAASDLGVFTQTGGTLNVYRYLSIGTDGTGVATFTGGTATIGISGFRAILSDHVNTNGTLNIGTEAGGTATFSAGGNGGIYLVGSSGGTSGGATLNLNPGTVQLTAGSIVRANTGETAAVNLNGGTVLSAVTGLTLINGQNALTVNDFNGGVTFNVSGSTVTDTVSAAILATTGNGVYVPGGTIAVPTANGGTGYIGAPIVTVSGGGGTGATAIANVSNGVITGVTLTSPGTGYTAGQTLSFAFNGGGTSTAAPTFNYTFGATSDPYLAANTLGGLAKIGSGVLLLTGSNTYTGATNVSAGTVQVNAGGSISTTSGISIGSGAVLAMNVTTPQTLNAPISGAGGFNQLGNTIVTFGGANTYSGPTNLNVGKLILAPGSSMGNTALTAASATTLYAQSSTGSYTFGSGSASISLLAGSNLSLADGVIDTLNLVNTAGTTALSLGNNSSAVTTGLLFDVGQTGADKIAVTGNVSAQSPVVISINTLSSANSLTPGSYTLISAGSGLGTSSFSLASNSYVINGTGYAFSLANSTPTSEILSITQVSGTLPTAYWAGAINNIWSTNNGNSTNWRTDASGNTDTGVTPDGTTNVFFTVSSGGANLATVLSSNQSINSLTFNGAAAGPVSISGNTLTINALALNNNPAGQGIAIQGGPAVTINSNMVVANSQTWANDTGNPFTVTGGISGGGMITQTGSGPVVLSGNSTFSGGYNLSSGSLAVNSAGALGVGPLQIESNTTLDNTSGSQIVLTNNNAEVWDGDFTFVGSSSLNMGTGAVTLTANRNVTLTANTLAVGGITDNGLNYSLTTLGNGRLLFNGTNTYTGATIIQGGSMSFTGSAGSTGNGSLDVAPNGGDTAVMHFNTSGSVSYSGSVTIADNAGAIGAINQSNGNISLLNAGNYNYLTIGNGGYGAYTMTGGNLSIGSVAVPSGIRIGGNVSSSVGNLLQTAGNLTSYRYLSIGTVGYGLATFTGGTTTITNGYRTIIGDNAASVGVMNLGTQAGGTNVFTTGGNGGLAVNSNGAATATLNLNAGTLNLSAGSIYQTTGSGTGTVNLNGAQIMAGATGEVLLDPSLSAVNVYNGGASFNVPTGSSATVTANLIGATGNGIYAGATGGTFAVSGNSSVGYVGAPVVTSITDSGSGTGAMAIANLTNGVITGVTLTNPGTGYQAGDNLTFTFSDGGYNTTASNFNYTLTASDIAANSGGFTKSGGGSLTVSGNNTYTGNTLVKGGTLMVGNSAALGTGKTILSNGTTLALTAMSPSTSLSGFSTNSNGVYTPVIAANGLSVNLTTTVGSEATSVFSTSPVTISDATGFVASFTYNHTVLGVTGAAADGITFVIQNTSANALGNPGGAIGYTGPNNVAAGGIGNSVAAVVNVYQNQIQTGENGVFTNSPGASTAPFISAGASSNVLVVYNGQTQTLTQTIISNVNGSSYTLVTTGVDVASLLGGTANGTGTGYFGFTGGTGGVVDDQSITNFSFSNTTTTLPNSTVAISNAVTVDTASAATIQLSPTAIASSGSVGPITIGNGSSLSLSLGSTLYPGVTRGVLTTPSVTLTNTSNGTFDISKNALDITSQSLASVRALVTTGYANGNWNGSGISSSTATADTSHLTAVGVILNTVNGNSAGAALYGSGTAMGLFEGLSPAATDVLVKYTYYGDTNLDGKVDGSDYSRIDAAYASHGSLTGWFNGDFNYDGTIDGSDYTLMDNAFNSQGAVLSAQVAAQVGGSVSGATSAVPEPTSLAVVGAMAVGTLSRRRRRA